MIKRIPCRVVSSKPLGEGREALRHVSASNNFHPKIGDIVTGIPRGNYANNPTRGPNARKSALGTLTYTRLLEVRRVSMANGLTGQILDCYV